MIDELEAAVEEYQRETPSQLIVENLSVRMCRIILRTEQTPIAFPIFLGEILHNLRGALDHLASSVVEHRKQEPNKRINFPVHETQRQFIDMRTRAKEPHQLWQVAPDVWQLIEDTVQPWKSNEAGGLIWEISKLNNLDKHRLLLIIPFLAEAGFDAIGSGFSMRRNLIINRGWGDFVFYEGPPVHLTKTEVANTLMLQEESVMPHTPLISFLKEAYNQIFGLIYAIETHMFGGHLPPKGT